MLTPLYWIFYNLITNSKGLWKGLKKWCSLFPGVHSLIWPKWILLINITKPFLRCMKWNTLLRFRSVSFFSSQIIWQISASNKSSLGGFEIFSNVSRLTGKLNKLNISSSRMPGKSEVKRQRHELPGRFSFKADFSSSYCRLNLNSLRTSSPIWASEASLARTRERAAKPRGAPRSRVLARLTSPTQIGELARRLQFEVLLGQNTT